MTQAELYQALKSIGYPIAYGSFTSPVTPPFITYQFANSNDFVADNSNYVEISNFQVELYTDKKDLNAEKLVQDKLKELGLPYRKFETYLDEEKMYQILYEVQLIGG
ncbi:hypothetical protein [Bacillus alveayuensis]|uniref:hypothetical protein n=1 Tax=Aeribacillus alveayuensis TaxID=279215 RepID=UPI0005D108CA|nr:hypothetical protein [Bacillus alveayuensis]